MKICAVVGEESEVHHDGNGNNHAWTMIHLGRSVFSGVPKKLAAPEMLPPQTNEVLSQKMAKTTRKVTRMSVGDGSDVYHDDNDKHDSESDSFRPLRFQPHGPNSWLQLG